MAGKKGRSGGRNRKSPDLHIVQGTARQDRMPDPVPLEPGTPTRPDFLNARACELWDYYADILSRRKVLSNADQGALAAFCQGLARYEEAESDISENGTVLVFETPKTYRGQCIETPKGDLVMEQTAIKNPAVTVALQLHQQVRGWVGLFGLSPADRSRVKAPPAAPKKKGASLVD